MGRVPVLKPQEVVRRLERLGFVEVRQNVAHKQFRHAAVAALRSFHKGRDLSPILLRQIAKDIGITVDELIDA